MLVAVYAYDNIYNGEHDMNLRSVIEVNTMEDAKEYAIAESLEVIEGYNSIMEIIEEEAEAYTDSEYDHDECYDRAVEDLMQDDVAYELYEIKKETTETLSELDRKFQQDPEAFVKEYC